MRKHPIVVVITGPCGVGKTTLSRMVSETFGFTLLCGDAIKNDLFPAIADITQYPEQLRKVKAALFEEGVKYFKSGKSVVIDYVILGEAYIKKYQETFKEHLVFVVLFPSREVIYHRDELRECWTSGKTTIDSLYSKYQNLVDLIGIDNYINSGDERPEQTFQKIEKLITF
ncbi:MAG: AAA family ATPase [Saprospiraceae bacterium]|nr:AAA family ATPase [Saprospiraceae bacterium]